MTSATVSFPKRPLPLSFAAAIAFHAALLLISGIIFVQTPEYGIDLGRGGMEVYLVAALVQMKASSKQEKTAENLPQITKEDLKSEMALPIGAAPPQLRNQKVLQKSETKLTAENAGAQGDG